MAVDEKVAKLILRMENDRAAAQQVRAAIQQHIADVKGIVKEQQRLDTQYVESRRALQQHDQAMDSGRRSLRAYVEEQEQAARAIRATNETMEQSANVVRRQQETGRTNNSSGLETVDRLGSLGTQISGAFGGSEVGNIVGLFGDAAQGIQQLGIVGGVTVGVIAAVNLALAEYNKGLEAQRSQLKAAFEAQEIYYRATAELTSTQVREQIAQRQQDSRIIAQQITETDNALNSAWEQMVAQFGDVGARALEATGTTPLGPLREQLAQLRAEEALNEQAITRLMQGLAGGAFAMNDTIDAIQSLARHEVELAELRRTATAEQIRDQIEANQTQADALKRANDDLARLAAAANFRGSTDAYERFNAQIQENILQIYELEAANRELTASILPAVEAMERLKEEQTAQKSLNDQRLSALEAEGEARRKLNQILVDQAALDTQTRAKEAEIRAAAAVEQLKAEDEAFQQRQENARKTQQEIEKQQQQHEDNVAEIHRRANATIANALRTRDVVAAILAEEARKEEERKERKAHDDRLKELETQLREQNEAVDKRLTEQQRLVKDNADKALATLRKQASDQRAILQQQQVEAETILRNAQAARIALQQTHEVEYRGIIRTGLNNLLMDARTFATELGNIFAPSPSAASGGSFTIPGNTAPRSNNITIHAANSTRQINNLSNAQARQVIREYLED